LSNQGGYSSLWRNLLEWTSQKYDSETIRVGVINSKQYPYITALQKLSPISFEELTINDITYSDISRFDVLYFIGLPLESGTELERVLEDYAKNGGGIYIEVPDISGEIEILKDIDSVFCTSINRPLFTNAYWTPAGKQHHAFIEPANIGFLTTLESSGFSSDWIPLMTSEPSDETIIIPDVDVITPDNIGSEFGIGYTVAMQNGVVEIDIDMSTSSSSSIDSSSSSSSSSTEEDESWDFCDNIVAYWKMDENTNSPVVWDESHDFQHMGLLKSGSGDIYTSSCHVAGVVNGALAFDGISQRIQTVSNISLNFGGTLDDNPFSISFWIYPKSPNGRILCKSGVWEVYLDAGFLSIVFYSAHGYRTYTMTSQPIPMNKWSNITFGTDGYFSGMSMYFNGGDKTYDKGQTGYTTMKNTNDSLYFASSALGQFFKGYIDNVYILDKKISAIEAEVLWNIGRGNEECHGIYRYSSSSTSSSSSSSNSSSSSIDSSSSSSSSSIDSSSSSSSSSIDSSSSSSSSSTSSESQS
jgi:hypothetical protein